MRPITAAITEALGALRSALDVRVYVAAGRALWDYVGKDLYEFVEGLSVSIYTAINKIPYIWQGHTGS